ncbi:MAG TPA: flagellar hook capping FlgD N-terminal domain-containing protein [Acidobacteriaceae bacterium]|nr:flagellar hook capping FlgD N-terminal domain-containing protein [Acidobacteriaceae bacterium]
MNIQGFTPMINAPMQPQAASTNGTSGSNNSTDTGNSSLSAGNLQGTFINLLVTELQNQDPTQPVDPSQMVAQMVSLNQLDQLIMMNETLNTIAGTAGTGTSGTGEQGSTASNPAAHAAAAKTSPVAANAFLTQPAGITNPVSGGLMNLYGNIATATTNSNHATQGGR